MQNTSHTSHTSHSKCSLTPSIVAAITIPILQKPIVVSTPLVTESSQKVGLSVPDSLIQAVPELGRCAVFDCEWYKENEGIYCFCLYDNTGHPQTFHINRFDGDRRAFMTTILETMEKYGLLIGYYIFGDYNIDSDLKHLENNCAKV